ncbi:MAG: helix-turn-helix domain-containing protein [Acutalibacteraceae bacterium]|nr:helix-turn-helix domain-containing protein [Acutalibacteraceae bacterium]
MTESFIGNRIAELVKVKKISTIKMSEDLAQSKDYIDNIIEHKQLPSMQSFLAICDYLELSPAEFFTE